MKVQKAGEIGFEVGALIQTVIELATPGKTRTATYIPKDTTVDTTTTDQELLTGTILDDSVVSTQGAGAVGIGSDGTVDTTITGTLKDPNAVYDSRGNKIYEGTIYTVYEDGSVARTDAATGRKKRRT